MLQKLPEKEMENISRLDYTSVCGEESLSRGTRALVLHSSFHKKFKKSWKLLYRNVSLVVKRSRTHLSCSDTDWYCLRSEETSNQHCMMDDYGQVRRPLQQFPARTSNNSGCSCEVVRVYTVCCVHSSGTVVTDICTSRQSNGVVDARGTFHPHGKLEK